MSNRRKVLKGAVILAAAIPLMNRTAAATNAQQHVKESNSVGDTDQIKEVVRRFNLEVIQDGQKDSFEELMSPNFVNRSAPAGAPNGPESMWHTFQNILRPALSGLTVSIHDQVAEGDRVATRKTISGTHTGVFMGISPTQRTVSIDVIDIVRIENGQYAEHWGINTLPSVLAQLKAG